MKSRWNGALGGFALFGLPGVLAALVLDWRDPLFADDPASLWALLVAVPGLAGALVGSLVKSDLPAGAPLTVSGLSLATIVGLWLGRPDDAVDGLDLLVVGVDGATWTQIDAMSDRLPAFTALKKDGAHGVMLAHDPLFSPLLWTELSTGKPPEENGVRGFHTTAPDCKVPQFFDVAESEGRSVGVYKWLVTNPPRHLLQPNGFIVPGWLAADTRTQPAELSFIKELELSNRKAAGGKRKEVAATRPTWRLALDGLDHGFRWSTVRDAALWTLEDKLTHPSEDRRFSALQLLRGRMDRDVFVWAVRRYRPSVATFTYYGTDAVSHRFWRYHEPEKFANVDPADVARYGDVIPAAYRDADEILGEARGLLPATGRLVVVSDHGFKALDEARDGVLLEPRVDHMQTKLEQALGDVDVARVGSKITVSLKGNVDEQREKLAALLATLTRKSNGEPLFKVNPVEDRPSDVALDLVTKHMAVGDLEEDQVGGEPMSAFVEAEKNLSGDHEPHGIFAALGPGVAAGTPVDADLFDVAPILLAAIGLGRGPDMRGHVPAGLWPDPGVRAESWDPVRGKLVFDDAPAGDVNEEQLKALGYTDGK